jgi:hypothetical protein
LLVSDPDNNLRSCLAIRIKSISIKVFFLTNWDYLPCQSNKVSALEVMFSWNTKTVNRIRKWFSTGIINSKAIDADTYLSATSIVASDSISVGVSVGRSSFRKKEERKKSLTRGHVEDIGSIVGIQSYRGAGVRRGYIREVACDFPALPSLCDGCAFQGACRARPMGVRDDPLLMGGLMMRLGWDHVCMVVIPSSYSVY